MVCNANKLSKELNRLSKCCLSFLTKLVQKREISRFDRGFSVTMVAVLFAWNSAVKAS